MSEDDSTIFYFEGVKKASSLLQLMSNERRLLMLCMLIEYKEMTVTALVENVGLSQSAVSQHLAKMREEGLVAFRRESQTLYYFIQDPAVKTVVETLKSIYCP